MEIKTETGIRPLANQINLHFVSNGITEMWAMKGVPSKKGVERKPRNGMPSFS